VRRRFHHLTFYGFMLCLAATTVAAFYENVLGSLAPYRVTSLPVVLGSLGGVGLLVGPAGLLWLKRTVPPEGEDTTQRPMDLAFLTLLILTAATGFLVLAFRESATMGVLLAIHLGVVAGLFISLPYGKFVHGIYRAIALVRYARER
jgi:citrate/tricarballylate utilization protein